MKTIHANSSTVLALGRCGENLVRKVVFDITDFEKLYGVGTVEILYQRPNDAQPYPLAVQRDGTSITWNVTSTDTAISSAFGKCELRYYSGETLVKSKIWQTWVENALSTPSETTPPEPEQGWVDQIIEVGAAAKSSADAAKADADRAAALAADVSEKAAQTAKNASDAAKAMKAAQTAQRLAAEAQLAAETAQKAAEAAQVAAETAATDAAGAKKDAETAQKAAQDAAAAAANTLESIQTLYQEMQTWAHGVIQDVNAAGSAAVQSVQTAGDAQVQRVTDEGATQTANAKAQADSAAQSAADAAQSAQQAEESAAVYDDVVADVNQLKQDLNNIFDKVVIGLDISKIGDVVKKEKFNAITSASGIYLQTNDNYDSYYFVSKNEADLYFHETSLSYLAICKGDNYNGNLTDSTGNITLKSSNAIRYRKSENNLPTETNKIHVNVGDVVAFTVPTGTTETVYGLAYENVVKDTFKNQIVEKNLKIKYSDSDNGHLYIYRKKFVGYVMYDFVHSIDDSKNSNVWRIDKAYAVTDTLTLRFNITTYGEWECALHLKDRSDFSGGIVHGDEIVTDIVFFVNGIPVDITSYTDVTDIDSLSIVQTSNLYDPADSSTIIATHGSEHIFGEEVTINQRILWKVDSKITACYLAMHLPSKSVTDRFYSDKNFTPETIANPLNKTTTKAKKVCVYSADGTVNTEMEVTEYPTGYTGGDMLLMTDNGGNAYNKCYFVISNDSNGIDVAKNTFWKSQTIYRFEIGK